MANSENGIGNEVGFAGLLSWVGKSAALISNIEGQYRDKVSTRSEPKKSQQFPGRQERSAILSDSSIGTTPTKMSGNKKALIWAGIIGGVIILIAISNSNDNNRGSTHTSSSSSSADTNSGPPDESKPPVGTNNVLGVSELHYCLAQAIRVDAAHDAANAYVQDQVDHFNAMVADYNSRCGEFRYREDDMSEAKSDIEQYRSLYRSQGRAQVQ